MAVGDDGAALGSAESLPVEVACVPVSEAQLGAAAHATHERLQAQVREQLGEAACATAWAEGEAMARLRADEPPDHPAFWDEAGEEGNNPPPGAVS